MWSERGWLILLRRRHERSLARPEGRLAKFRQRIFRGPRKLAYTGTTSGGRNTSSSVVEVDLEEGGCSSDWGLVRTVVTVVEIQEEGLFRHIVTYL